MEIDFEALENYLKSLKVSDFDRHGNIGIVKKGYAMDDIEFFKKDIDSLPPEQIIDYNKPFLVDILGNDLSIVLLTKRKYKMPNGRTVRAKFVKTIVSDCRSLYGTPLNGYWIIPKKFILTNPPTVK